MNKVALEDSLKLLLVCCIVIATSINVNAQSAEAVKLCNLGIDQANRNSNDSAITSFSSAINLHPNYTSALNWRGATFYKKAEYDIAMADFQDALRTDPNYHYAHFNMGRVYYQKKEYDKAIIAFQDALKNGADKKSMNWWIGDCYYYGKKDYDAAINSYNQIIRFFPTDVDGYRLRSYVYSAKKEYDKAISDHTTIIKLDPANANAYNLRGLAYRDQKMYDNAIKEYSEAIKIKPKEPLYYRNRGTAYRILGDTALAIADYNMAVAVSGKANDYVMRGGFFRLIRQYDEALKDFNEAIRLEPNAATRYVSRGYFYHKTKAYALALADYKTAMEKDPKLSTPYYYRGYMHQEMGNYELAVKDDETFITLNPATESGLSNVISPLVRLNQWDKAKMYAEKFLATNSKVLDDDKWKFYKHYINIVHEDIPAGRFENALARLDQSIKEYSSVAADEDNEARENSYIDILALKGYILEKMSRFEEAKEAYEQALVIHDMQPDVKQALDDIVKKKADLAVNDKTAPEILLISPQSSRGLQVVSNNAKTQVIGKAKDPSGISFVTVNGIRIDKIEEDGTFTTAVAFRQGANSLLVTATDKKGNKGTKTFNLQGNANQPKEEDIIVPIVNNTVSGPQYHAIIIAAKDYTDPKIPDLENPVRDANDFKAILESQYTFSSKNVETLYNKSREEIMQSIIVKSSSLGENDNLLIFYAGHGIAEKDKFGDVDGYWIPSSAKKGNTATYISADDIKKSLKRSNSKHILVIADACFSGAFTRELSSDASVGVQKQYNVSSRKIMASGNMEPVPDNSRFIYYLKKNLRENKDKYLTAKKLFDSFYEAILNNSDTSPQYAAIKNIGDEGGEFVFIKK